MKTTTNEPKEYVREKTGRLIPCAGEAHKNPFIDNCGMCAPRWGEVEELAPFDLAKARAERLDLPACDLNEAENAEMMAARDRGEVTLEKAVRKHGWGSRHYHVFRWVVAA